jgi:hypothetical protein
MKTENENCCCGSYPCLTTTNEYQQWREIHLDYSILTAVLARRKPDSIHKAKAKFYRQEAYRQYSYWKYGPKGKGNRSPNPSCVVWSIRNCYPDLNGEYEGFIKIK